MTKETSTATRRAKGELGLAGFQIRAAVFVALLAGVIVILAAFLGPGVTHPLLGLPGTARLLVIALALVLAVPLVLIFLGYAAVSLLKAILAVTLPARRRGDPAPRPGSDPDALGQAARLRISGGGMLR